MFFMSCAIADPPQCLVRSLVEVIAVVAILVIFGRGVALPAHHKIALLRRRIEAAMFFYAALLVGAVHAAHFRSDGQAGENPIRKIVSLLQKMQKEVMDEQDKDTELNEKSGQYM